MVRPKLNARKVQTSVTLKESDANMLRKVGDGNLSEGISIVIRFFQESKDGREIENTIKEEAQAKLEKLDPLFG